MKNKAEFSVKAWLIFTAITILGLSIFGKVVYIQLGDSEKWEQKQEEFAQRVRAIPATRGQILADDNSLLASSIPVYEIRWDSKAAGIDNEVFFEELDSLCIRLSELFGDRPASEYKQWFVGEMHTGNRYALVKRKVTYSQMKEAKEFPYIRKGSNKSGFIFSRKDVRMKPFGELASRTIGRKTEESGLGLERAYDEELSGREGQQLMMRIAGNTWRPVTGDFIEEPIEGLDVQSTINVHLQDIAQNALKEQLEHHSAEWGCVVLMEVETGYVKAVANLGWNEESGKYIEDFNYAIGQLVEPGSTFKLPALMAALESGKISLTDSIDTGNGIKKFYGRTVRDSNWDEGGHGKGSVEEVFEWSSNVGMAVIADSCFRSNKQQFLDILNSYGLGDKLGITILGEGEPNLYKSIGDDTWSGISHQWLSFGYEVEQTPIQILAFYNAVANNGRLMRPLFASALLSNGSVHSEIEPVVLNKSICEPALIKQGRKVLEGVCEEGGTAYRTFSKSPYKVAGKTGTAWLHKGGSYQGGRYRGSFVGYFPTEKPKYSCIVVINDPKTGVYYGSSLAAPVFKKLSDHIYSTQMEMDGLQEDQEMIATTRIPVSKGGSQEELKEVFASLGISYKSETESNWVNTSTKEDHVLIEGREIQSGLVPNVRGMGLQDALFLLENCGLKVKIHGSGTVKQQSLTPGTRIIPNQSITIDLS